MRLKIVAIVASLLIVPVSAVAQGRVPHKESGAVGGDIGVFLPAEDALGSGLVLEGFYEYYLTARTSLRTGVGWANPKFDREGSDSLRHVRVGIDALYNWEGGQIHPFVGAGFGVYFLQFRDNGENVGDSETKVGAVLSGGVEWFANRTTSVKGELRYHLIENIGAFNPDGAALTIGLKKYF